MGFFSFFSKEKKETLDKGLSKTKESVFGKIARAVAGKSKVDDEVLDNLEEVLITSDVGVETTLKIIERIEKRAAADKYMNATELNHILRDEIAALLTENNSEDVDDFEAPIAKKPYVIMVVGVNGVGKTTTIGKLAYQFKKAGKSVYLGAADTFRAAAVEQLVIWGERVGVPVVKQKMGADPASVAFDTLSSATANNADVVIIDTAGRLHNKVGLMNELTKIKNVMKKVVPDAPNEVLLVLDGSTGQNAFEQAKQFTLATEVTAMAVTKLDGTAKGGVVIGISDQFKIPVKYIGLESKFPLLAVEGGCIISKDADITVVYRVELPELFTVTSAEYEAIHAAWCKALKVLPEYSVVHKQDWFIRERYRPATGEGDMSFLSRSYERHFNERPFLTHACFLYLTKTTRERMHMRSDFSTLCRGNIIPKEVNRESATKFLEAAEQFERILNDSGFLALVRLTGDEITGTADCPGLLERYFSLSLSETTSLQDIELGAEVLRVGNKRVCLHTLSDTEDLPGRVGTDTRYERLSTDRSDCLLSFAAPVGLLLSCDHLYNQYVFLEDSDENLRMFEKRARNMQSLSRYSRGNQINKEWIDQYLNEAHSFGLQSVRAHFNVLAWSDDVQELRHIRNDVGSQLALMECRPRHNTVDAATLYWAGQ